MIRKKISRRTFLAALPAAALVLAGCSNGKKGGTSESTLISRNETASASKVDTAAPSIASRKVLLVNYPSHSTLKLLNPDGTEICSLEGCDFSVPVCKDGKFPIRKKEKFGYADIDGNLLLKPVYDYPPSYVDGFFTAVKNGMTGYADADGAFFLSPQYCDAGVFSHGLAPVKQDDLWGFIDRSGEFVIPPQFESKPSSFSANFASCSINKQSGIIDQNGNWIASNFTPFYSTLPFYDGYVVALSTESKQFCYVDTSGKVSIDGPFSAAGDFCEERAVVEEDNAFGFIDTNGNYIFKPQADVIANYHDGFAFVRTPDFTGFLDKKGKKQSPSRTLLIRFLTSRAICSPGVKSHSCVLKTDMPLFHSKMLPPNSSIPKERLFLIFPISKKSMVRSAMLTRATNRLLLRAMMRAAI